LKIQQKQELLEAASAKERLEKLSEILSREIEIVEIERRINMRVRKQMEKTQKEYYLREQMKAIQKELGEKDERTAEADEYREKISKAALPLEVEEKGSRRGRTIGEDAPGRSRRDRHPNLPGLAFRTALVNGDYGSSPIWIVPPRSSMRITTACTK